MTNSLVKTGAMGFSSSAITAFLGMNPVTLVAFGALAFGPEVLKQHNLNKAEAERLAKEQYRNRRVVKDPLTGHEWTFKRDATEADWKAITKRFNQGRGEDLATILESLGLID